MIKIELLRNPEIEDSQSLNFLNEKLNDEQINSVPSKIHQDKAKGDITISLEIASLVLSSIATFISVLDYWKNQYPNYSITLKFGENTYNRKNLSRKEFEEEMRKAEKDSKKVKVEISKEDN